MRSHAVSFAAGAAGFAALTYAAGFHASAWTFAAGFLCALLLAAAALGSRARLTRAARTLAAVAAALGGSNKTLIRPAAQLAGTPAEVADALCEIGARRPAATAAARKAAELHPGAGFDDLFRAALPFTKGATQ
jgi:hypothetical protein